jgi:hypothetical protein
MLHRSHHALPFSAQGRSAIGAPPRRFEACRLRPVIALYTDSRLAERVSFDAEPCVHSKKKFRMCSLPNRQYRENRNDFSGDHGAGIKRVSVPA